jgi:predicted negative regulator of RcsB-dependent stress response
VEVYQTEEQQVDAIRSYWRQNGNYIIAGLAIGLASYVGFNFYQDSILAEEIARSDAYQIVVEQIDKDLVGFQVAGDDFIVENAKTSYASLAALSLAKETASHKDWKKTASYLTAAIENAPNEGVKAIATVRLARVQIQLAEFDKALATLASKLPTSFNASVEEIKGDAYLKQGKTELARTAYQLAIAADGLATRPVLQMKLDNLAQAINLNGDVK